MIMEDHINLMNTNPLIGINEDSLGPRFPNMSGPYNRELIDRAVALEVAPNVEALKMALKGIDVAQPGIL